MVERIYLKPRLILLVITSIIGFLVQDLFHVYFDQHSINFSHWKSVIGTNETEVSITRQWADKTKGENKTEGKETMPYSFEQEISFHSSNSKAFGEMNQSVHADEQRRLKTRRTVGLEKEGKANGTFGTLSRGDRLLTGTQNIGTFENTIGEAYPKVKENIIRINESSFSNIAIAPTPLPSDVRHKWPESSNKALNIFILSAIGNNITNVYGFNREIKLNGWRAAKHSLVTIKCCISWNNNMITEFISPNMTTRGKRLNLVATSITCPIKGPFKDVKGVTLEFAQSKCPTDESSYTKPFIPRQKSKRHSFAVCLKLLYGDVNTKLLIDWMEFYREIKVDKIFMFVYNISQETQPIIKRYVSLGILETRQFEFPWKTRGPVGMKTPRFWEDEQVVVYDCFHRLYGYNYVAILDLDEFLLPRKHGNIKDTMAYLMTTYPKAAGFALKMFIFNKAWGTSGRANGSDIVQYIQRTPALVGVKARSKNILIPSRVLVDSNFYTHEFKPKPGYESFAVHESIAAVNHYRFCYKNLVNACSKKRRVIDTDIFKVVERFQNRTL